jgi:hypothetical protein
MANKKFHVAGNISHNGSELKRGDTLSLDPKSKEALALLAAGAIQTHPLDAEPEEVEVDEEEQAETEEEDEDTGPKVGGEPSDLGEDL